MADKDVETTCEDVAYPPNKVRLVTGVPSWCRTFWEEMTQGVPPTGAVRRTGRRKGLEWPTGVPFRPFFTNYPGSVLTVCCIVTNRCLYFSIWNHKGHFDDKLLLVDGNVWGLTFVQSNGSHPVVLTLTLSCDTVLYSPPFLISTPFANRSKKERIRAWGQIPSTVHTTLSWADDPSGKLQPINATLDVQTSTITNVSRYVWKPKPRSLVLRDCVGCVLSLCVACEPSELVHFRVNGIERILLNIDEDVQILGQLAIPSMTHDLYTCSTPQYYFALVHAFTGSVVAVSRIFQIRQDSMSS